MIVLQRHGGLPLVFENAQGTGEPEQSDGLARFIVFRRVGGPASDLLDVLSDPVGLLREEIADRPLRIEARRDHADLAVRRQDRDADVFDLSPDEHRLDAVDRDALFRVHL